MIRNNRGITLIALIITIIVMLILVAVTISMAVKGGLFGYAGNAAKETEAAKQNELSLADGVINGKTIEQLVNGESIPTINEYGFYYDSPYSVTVFGDDKASVVLKENRKIEYYLNGIPNSLDLWNLEFVPGNNKVTINSIDCFCSNEGKTITVPGNLMNVLTGGAITTDTDFTNTFEKYHNLYTGKTYYCDDVDLYGIKIDESGKLYMVDWIAIPENDTEINNIGGTLSTTSHIVNINGNTPMFLLSMDGKKLVGYTTDEVFTRELEYPWVMTNHNDNSSTTIQNIKDGSPTEGCRVVYEKYSYVYHASDNGYTAILRDSSQTFNSNEVLSNIYGVTVINKN